MEKDLFNNLSPQMQERLNKWKANVLPVKNASIVKAKSPGSFVSRRRDYGDDMNEFTNPKAKNE